MMARRRSGAMSAESANDVYDVLVERAGASEDQYARHDFVYHQTQRWCDEFRFGGLLGFGGKFWRNYGTRPDGTRGERWYVSAYKEDIERQPERQIVIDVANDALDQHRAVHEAVQAAGQADAG